MKPGLVIWLEGIIGAGKSTLAATLARELALRAFHEPVDTNPYLERFYKDPKRWAFPMQIHLMHDRFAMQKEAAYSATRGFGSILDRGMPGDRVFCKLHMLAGNIDELEWKTYEKAYEVMACSLNPPALLLFLDVEPDIALERVKTRARGAESGITLKYLQDLRKGYLDLMCEIESGVHPWSRGMEVKRIAWNSDYLPVDSLVDSLRSQYKIPNSTHKDEIIVGHRA
jgi:deoxyadenosine/deoxycytidine kinase